MEKEIEVYYLTGTPLADFDDLNSLGFSVHIPKDEGPKYLNSTLKPEDYIIIFGVVFSLKVTENIAKELAKALVNKFPQVIKNIWTKRRSNSKPVLLVAGQEPIEKSPKAVISFQIDDKEFSKLEITDETPEKEMKQILKTYLKLVALQYKNRLKEQKLKDKMRLKA